MNKLTLRLVIQIGEPKDWNIGKLTKNQKCKQKPPCPTGGKYMYNTYTGCPQGSPFFPLFRRPKFTPNSYPFLSKSILNSYSFFIKSILNSHQFCANTPYSKSFIPNYTPTPIYLNLLTTGEGGGGIHPPKTKMAYYA